MATTNPGLIDAIAAVSAAGMGWYALVTQKQLPLAPPQSPGLYVNAGPGGASVGVDNSLLWLGGLGLLAYFLLKK